MSGNALHRLSRLAAISERRQDAGGMQSLATTDTAQAALAAAGPGSPAGALARAVGTPLAEPASASLALYAADWARFAAWCRTHGHTALPATSEVVAAFLLAMATGRSRGSLGRLRAAIGTTHRRAGLPVPRLDANARRALRAVATPKQTARSGPAQSPATLLRMSGRCARDTAGLRDRALLLLAAGLPAGRRSGVDGGPGVSRRALLGLDAEHLRLTPDGVVLQLRAHDGEAEPTRSVALARNTDALTCPVRALEDWLRASDTRYGPVFRKVTRWGSCRARPARTRRVAPHPSAACRRGQGAPACLTAGTASSPGQSRLPTSWTPSCGTADRHGPGLHRSRTA